MILVLPSLVTVHVSLRFFQSWRSYPDVVAWLNSVTSYLFCKRGARNVTSAAMAEVYLVVKFSLWEI